LGYVEQNGYELYFGKAFENIRTFFQRGCAEGQDQGV